MKKKMLFDVPNLVFEMFINKFNLSNNVRDFKIIWMGITLPAKYVILPNTSKFKPTLVYFDIRSLVTNINSVRLILLNNLPKLDIDGQVEDILLDQHSSIEVGEYESTPSEIDEIIGYNVKLYLEFHSSDLGIKNLTDNDSIFVNIYSTQMLSYVYDLYLNGSYNWVSGYFKTKEGKILPLKNYHSFGLN